MRWSRMLEIYESCRMELRTYVVWKKWPGSVDRDMVVGFVVVLM